MTALQRGETVNEELRLIHAEESGPSYHLTLSQSVENRDGDIVQGYLITIKPLISIRCS
jgi:hypothetical protein